MLRNSLRLVACIGLASLLCGASPASAQAVAPTLIATAPNAIVSDTYTNSLNTGLETAIRGNVCFTTPPATAPVSVVGTFGGPCAPAMGPEQNSALATLNSQGCTSLGAAVALNSSPGHPTGIYGPGCYSSTAAMTITLGTTVTLNGPGVYIFRPGGALTTGDNSFVLLAGGACANDVFWTPVGGTTLGQNAITTPVIPTFVGNIFRGTGAGLSITLGHFAHLQGRALAFGSTVTTDSNTIDAPTCATFVTPTAPTPPSSTDLFITKSHTTTFVVGQNGVYTIQISNLGTVASNGLITVTDILPTGLTFVSATGANSWTCSASGQVITCTTPASVSQGTFGNPIVITVVPTADAVPVVINRASIAGGNDSNLANNTTVDSTIVALSVPTLPEWAFLMLGMLLTAAGALALRRRRRAI